MSDAYFDDADIDTTLYVDDEARWERYVASQRQRARRSPGGVAPGPRDPRLNADPDPEDAP